MDRVTSSTSTVAAVASLVVAMASFQLGAAVAKQLIPAIGAPGTTALRLGLSALIYRIWLASQTVPSCAPMALWSMSLATTKQRTSCTGLRILACRVCAAT
jgi:inner membrane transporter RhtA